MKINEMFEPHRDRLDIARGQCALAFREELNGWFVNNGFVRVQPRPVQVQNGRPEYYEYNDLAELGRLCQWSWSFVELRYGWQNRAFLKINLSRSGSQLEAYCVSRPHEAVNFNTFHDAVERRFDGGHNIRITTKSLEAFKKRFDTWTRNI